MAYYDFLKIHLLIELNEQYFSLRKKCLVMMDPALRDIKDRSASKNLTSRNFLSIK